MTLFVATVVINMMNSYEEENIIYPEKFDKIWLSFFDTLDRNFKKEYDKGRILVAHHGTHPFQISMKNIIQKY